MRRLAEAAGHVVLGLAHIPFRVSAEGEHVVQLVGDGRGDAHVLVAGEGGAAVEVWA